MKKPERKDERIEDNHQRVKNYGHNDCCKLWQAYHTEFVERLEEEHNKADRKLLNSYVMKLKTLLQTLKSELPTEEEILAILPSQRSTPLDMGAYARAIAKRIEEGK